MQVDKTTLNDLAIFHREEEQSVFHFLDFTTTVGGKEWFRHLLANPHTDLDKILQTQKAIQIIIEREQRWPTIITNGTIMVVLKYYDSSVDAIPADPSLVNALLYKTTKGHDYSLIKFSVNQFVNFLIGLRELVELLDDDNNPRILQSLIDRIKSLTTAPVIQKLMSFKKDQKISITKNLQYGNYLLYNYKQMAHELADIYNKLDAYHGIAKACQHFNFSFPEISNSNFPFVEGKNVYHPLVNKAVSYDVQLNQQGNFIFLTGANMAGKSTFIKAVGLSVYLAHIGMAVPADSLRLSLFDGLLSNIQVEDNITKGESYFFNEVQRIKKTIEKINDGRKWLILIDELFKGTNVQDAMKCSTVVIEGLRKMKNTLFILSTHLYEIGENLRQYPNIRFNYFETKTNNDQLEFSYKLKEGISNDRLGYLILKREGVVDLLEKL